jgi:uncharacterized protein YyaL (SSP411 family)
VLDKSPQQAPSLIAALDWYRHCTVVKSTGDRLAALTGQYLQTTALKVFEALPTDSIALVCQGLNCLAPSQTTEDLQAQIQQSIMRD